MSSKGATVSVLYPRKEGFTFNEEYYNGTHMPLVEKAWKKHGLKSWIVTKFGEETPYTHSAIIEFESPEALGAALADPATAEVTADVANFSNQQPVIAAGGVLARSSL